MDYEREYDEVEEMMEYLDENFFDMDLDEQIQYLHSNPDVKIDPEDVESDYFYELSEAVLEKGEEELSITLLKKYFEAAVELQQQMYYRRAKPSFDAIYRYGMHLLNNEVTSFDDMDNAVKKMLISFCIMNEYIDACDSDEFLDEYPQLTAFYENLDVFAYADDQAMCPMLLLSVGKAYQTGTKHFKKDLEKAFQYFEIGANLDYSGRQVAWPFQKVADCAFEVAACYHRGLGVEKDLDQALQYYCNAASEYGVSAVPAMAEIYLDPAFAWEEYFDSREDLIIAAYDACEDGCGDDDDDSMNRLQEAILTELKEFANRGDTEAKYRLARAYEQGIFVEQDLEIALRYHAELMQEGAYPHSALFLYENHTPEERASYQMPESLKVGDEFYLGQMMDEPLKWKVMEIHEDGPVVISEKVLAVLPYNDGGADYPNSYIRHWLNECFFQKAFTDEEKQCVLDEEYYAISFAPDSYGETVKLKDPVFLPYSSNIEAWYGEGQEEWNLLYTNFALQTGTSDDCWLLDVVNDHCPKHVSKHNTDTRFRYHSGCKLGIRPIMVLKTK